MLREFAVEPEVFSEFRDLRNILSQCGAHKGRMISQFPKGQWSERVKEIIRKYSSTRDISKATELIASIREKLISKGRTYNEENSWIQNALLSNEKDPFHCVITKNSANEESGCLSVDEMTFEEESWNIPIDLKIPRQADAIAEVAEPLLYISSRISLVDRNFRFFAYQIDPILKLYSKATSGTPISAVMFHISSGLKDDLGTPNDFKIKCREFAKKLNLSPSQHFVFIRWKKSSKGEKLHARYVLTDKGGISFDHGLDEGKSGETTDVKLLGRELWEQRWNQYQLNSNVLGFCDAWILEGNQVRELDRQPV
jgi:hypothetical protein